MVDAYVELYRSSVICDLLTDTLEELAVEGKITQDLAVKVLHSFDKSCLEALTKRAEAKGLLSVRTSWSYAIREFQTCSLTQTGAAWCTNAAVRSAGGCWLPIEGQSHVQRCPWCNALARLS